MKHLTLALCLTAASTLPAWAEPKLILLTQSALADTNGNEIRVWPSYIATKVAHIETLRLTASPSITPSG